MNESTKSDCQLQINAMYFLESTMRSNGSLIKNEDDVLNLIWGAHQAIQAMSPDAFKADNFDSIYSDAMASANRAGEAMVSTLPPHQQRVVDENIELNDRLLKLQAFIGAEGKNDSIFDKLDVDEQSRLRKQHDFMLNYSAILIARIAAFK